jgi:hypothetical protein
MFVEVAHGPRLQDCSQVGLVKSSRQWSRSLLNRALGNISKLVEAVDMLSLQGAFDDD